MVYYREVQTESHRSAVDIGSFMSLLADVCCIDRVSRYPRVRNMVGSELEFPLEDGIVRAHRLGLATNPFMIPSHVFRHLILSELWLVSCCLVASWHLRNRYDKAKPVQTVH